MAATIEDLEALLMRPLTESEVETAQILLNHAMLIIRNRIPDLDERLEDGRIDQEVLDMVQANMVVRVLKNPDGYRQESAGDYSYTIAANVPVGGGLFLTPQEARWLGIGGSLGSFRPTLPVPGAYDCWGWRVV